VHQVYPADAARPEIATVSRGDTGDAARSAVAALAGLYAYPAGPASSAAPWVRANMIASADGAGSLNGRSGGLSGPGDRLAFSVLRSLADVILVGAGTARAEKYRPVKPGEVWPALRDGRAPTPPIAVVTTKLGLDLDSPLLASAPESSRTIVLTTEQCPDERRAAAAAGRADVIVAGADRITPAAMIDALAARGHRRILIEGGPHLLGQITAAGLLDELCLTYSPVLEGGRAGRILIPPYEAFPGQERHEGPAAWPPADLTLAHVLEDSGSLLCRYLAATAPSSTRVPRDRRPSARSADGGQNAV
jgi:riboflavin biosynthesis pyrimidine reductase